MKKRIIGIDVARALAVIGMIIVNFKVVFGDNGHAALRSLAHLFDGKAAATFVVLAGTGLALMTNSAIKKQHWKKLKITRMRIIKRAIFLFIIGLSYIWIWPADILHFYGIYMLVVLLFLQASSRIIWGGIAFFTLLFPVLLLFFDYETGWNFKTLEYLDFWEPSGFIRNLFFNGFHPVIPWTAFMLYGLWLGKQDLRNSHFLTSIFRNSLVVFILIQVLSVFLVKIAAPDNEQMTEQLQQLFGTNPMPPLPFYILNGIAISTVIITGCILLANRLKNNRIILALNKTGQLALTFYVAHVVLGMGLIETFFATPLGNYSIAFSMSYALIFSFLCIVFAEVWLKYKKSGPLEWVMRKLTD